MRRSHRTTAPTAEILNVLNQMCYARAVTPRRKLTSSQWAEFRTAHASGIGLRELARNAGIAPGTVLSRAKRERWTQRIESARTLARQSPPSTAAVSDAAAATMAERGQRHLQRVAGIVEKTVPHVESMEPGAILDRIEDLDRLDRIGRRTYGLDDQQQGQSGFLAIQINIG